MRCLFLAASAVLLIALPARAERANDAATLEYLSSRATIALCPAADSLALEVQLRLGYELFQPSAPAHLTVKIDRADGRFRAIAEMRDDDGNVLFARTHSEIDCTQAVLSTAISVAVYFTKPPEDPEPSPPNEPPPTPACPEPEAPPAPPPPLPERPRFQAGVASVFSIGVAPSVLGGVGWFVGVRWPRVSLALEGRALFAPSATIARAPTRDGYHFEFAAVSGTGCYHPAWAFICAGAGLGSLAFGNTGIDISSNRPSILSFSFRVGSDWILTPRIAIRAYAEMSLQPLETTLRRTPAKLLLWSQPIVAGSLGVGPVFTFSEI